MENEQLIPADEWCTYYNVELSFVNLLEEYGLIQVTIIEEKRFIPFTQLTDLEKYARLHYDLNINPEGIDAIAHLLDRIRDMHHQITLLQHRLHTYEVTENNLKF